MAVVTVSDVRTAVVGDRKVVSASIAAISDGTTWDTGLISVDPGGVLVTPHDASTVAADSIAVTVSGGTVTFETAGTARAQYVQARGF